MNENKSFKTIIAEIKMAYNISDYIRQSGLKLTSSGSDKWKGLCPFHQEKSPSFSVNDQFQNYRCFGCGAHGDILSFVEKTENLEFFEAVKKLAEEKGIEVTVGENKEGNIDYKSLRECLKESANFFVREFRKLPAEHPAKKQISDRGLKESTMLYGYAPEKRTALYDHLKTLKFNDETILQAGVATKWEDSGKFSDFWTGRLMFFITDITGKPIGFSGRKLFEGDSRGKFVNSQAGPLFDKSGALFNVQNAKKPASDTKEIYVAEGQFDVAALMEAGVTNTVAASGTAFTSKQGQILQRLVGETGKIIFAFDGDQAGVKAAISVFNNVPSIHASSFVAVMPAGVDPCDYRLSEGNEALTKLVSEDRVSLIEFVLNAYSKTVDMTSEVGRSQYLDYASKVIKTIASESLRATYIPKVSLEAFTDVDTVRSLVKNATPLDLKEASAQMEENKQDTQRDYLVSEELTEAELISKIENNKVYNLSARFIALTLIKPELIEFLPKNITKLPSEFTLFINELCSIGEDNAVIPESFTESVLADYLINANYFPMSHVENFDAKRQFKYIYQLLMSEKTTMKSKKIKAKFASIIAQSNNEGAEFLKRVLEKEQEELG